MSRKPKTLEEIELLESFCDLKSRGDFYAYRQWMSGFKLKTGWFVRRISGEMQEFYEDYKAGKRPILVIQSPPQMGKSSVVVDFITWAIGREPSLRFIYASFSERLGIRANRTLQRVMDAKKYQRIFPGTVINNKQVVTAKGLERNRTMVETSEGGSFRNTTVRGSVTGETLDIGVIDDPIRGRNDANSKTVRNATWDWFTDDFFTRFDDLAAMVIVLTRWHVDDPVGRLLDSEMKDRVKVLTFPAIAEDDEEHRAKGEALFPEHKSLDFLMARKAVMDAAHWSALYQQMPYVKGGGVFRPSEWPRYDNFEDLYTGRRANEELVATAIHVDTAQKTKEINDWSVFSVFGIGRSGDVYLLDMARGKWEGPELRKVALSIWDKWKFRHKKLPVCRGLFIEEAASGTGLVQDMIRYTKAPVTGIRRTVDKATRALDAQPFCATGRVWLPHDAQWMKDFLSEVEAFSLDDGHLHDDITDTMMDAVSHWVAKEHSMLDLFGEA